MFKNKLKIVALLVGSLAVTGVNAANLSYSTNIYGLAFEFFTPDDTSNWNKWLEIDSISLSGLPQFNPATGTLTAATLTIGDGSDAWSYSTSVMGLDVVDESLDNSMDASSWVSISAYFPTGGPAAVYESLPDSVSCNGEAGFGLCGEFTDNTDNIMQSSTYTDADLAHFIGAGTLEDITVGMFVALTSFNSDNVVDPFADIWSEFDGVVSVEYEYTVAPVPLPAAVWLFGSGFLWIVAVSRRRSIAGSKMLAS